MKAITGQTLLDWGYQPGSWFAEAIAAAEAARQAGVSETEIRAAVGRLAPPSALPLRALGELAHRLNIRAEGPD